MSQFGVVIVATTSAALRAEKLLQTAGIKVQLIPTPREFTSDCGLAVRFSWDQHESVAEVLQVGNVDIVAIHQLQER